MAPKDVLCKMATVVIDFVKNDAKMLFADLLISFGKKVKVLALISQTCPVKVSYQSNLPLKGFKQQYILASKMYYARWQQLLLIGRKIALECYLPI